MFERFTERARQVVVLAQEEARTLKHNYIGTEHILLGLLREEEGLAARVLESLDITVERVRAPGRADRRLRRGGHLRADPVHAARQEGARAGAARGAEPRPQLHRHRAHPARAWCARTRASPRASCSTSTPTPRRSATRSSACSPAPAVAARASRRGAGGSGASAAPGEGKKSSKLLDQFGRNLTKLAAEGKLDPCRRARDRDRADHADPLAPHQEQPRAGRRARRRQDRRGRGPGAAHHQLRRARAAQEQADLHARPGRAGRRLEVPRRVRGAPEEGDEGDHPARRHHPVHRRAPQPRRRRAPPRARSTPPRSSSRRWRAASCRRSARRRSTSTASTSSATRRSSGASSRSASRSRRSTRPSRSSRACATATSSTTRCRSPTRRCAPPANSPSRYISDRFLPDKAIDLIDEAASRMRIKSMTSPPANRELEPKSRRRGARRRPRSRRRSSRRPRRCATRSAS